MHSPAISCRHNSGHAAGEDSMRSKTFLALRRISKNLLEHSGIFRFNA